jgi:hypothetical protein
MRIHFPISILLFWLYCTAFADSSPAEYYTTEELKSLGTKITSIDANQSILCDETGQHCVCQEQLTCGIDKTAPCPSFTENVKSFQTALNTKQGKRRVTCNSAETGQCDEFLYFHFDGDIERYETRWFNTAGQMVAQRNRSDYASYCNGQTTTRIQGKIPKCGEMLITKLLCGAKTDSRVPTAIDTVTGIISTKPLERREDRPPLPC